MPNVAVCACHVHYLAFNVKVAARRGAHAEWCGLYRESLDPVDRRGDHNARAHWADLNCAECFGAEWRNSDAPRRAAQQIAIARKAAEWSRV